MKALAPFAPALAALIAEAALQVSGYQNRPLSVVLAVLAGLLALFGAWAWWSERKASRPAVSAPAAPRSSDDRPQMSWPSTEEFAHRTIEEARELRTRVRLSPERLNVHLAREVADWCTGRLGYLVTFSRERADELGKALLPLMHFDDEGEGAERPRARDEALEVLDRCEASARAILEALGLRADATPAAPPTPEAPGNADEPSRLIAEGIDIQGLLEALLNPMFQGSYLRLVGPERERVRAWIQRAQAYINRRRPGLFDPSTLIGTTDLRTAADNVQRTLVALQEIAASPPE